MFQSLKNFAIESAASRWFQANYGRYGRLTGVKIDRERRVIELVLALAGDPQPVELVIDGYELEATAGEMWMVIRDIATSRAWMNAAIDEFVSAEMRRVKVPAAVRSLL